MLLFSLVVFVLFVFSFSLSLSLSFSLFLSVRIVFVTFVRFILGEGRGEGNKHLDVKLVFSYLPCLSNDSADRRNF